MCGSILDASSTLDDVLSEITSLETQGFAFAALANIFGVDAIMVAALAGRATSRIEITTNVVPSPPRHPLAMAQEALTAQAACGGRFVLGIGLSHQIVIENMMGLSYAHPAAQMREYLQVLMPLARGEPSVAHAGEYYNVNCGIQVPGAASLPVVVAALGPRMLRTAGELADGTTTWLTGLRTLESHIVPSIRRAAEDAGRPAPRIIASLPIALCSKPEPARELCSQAFQMYGQMPSYRAMLDREGAAAPGDVALMGNEATLRADLQRLRDAGVTDYAAACFEAEAGVAEQTMDFLRSEF